MYNSFQQNLYNSFLEGYEAALLEAKFAGLNDQESAIFQELMFKKSYGNKPLTKKEEERLNKLKKKTTNFQDTLKMDDAQRIEYQNSNVYGKGYMLPGSNSDEGRTFTKEKKKIPKKAIIGGAAGVALVGSTAATYAILRNKYNKWKKKNPYLAKKVTFKQWLKMKKK